MFRNIGSTDAIFRLVLATALLAAEALGALTGTPALIANIVAAVLGLTVAIGICPAYMPFGLKTDCGTSCCNHCGGGDHAK